MSEIQTASLSTPSATLIMEWAKGGPLVWRYLGAHLAEVPPASSKRWGARATFSLDEDVGFPLIPSAGFGWFGPSALEIRTVSGSGLAVDLEVRDFESQPDRITVVLADCLAGVECTVQIAVLPGGAFAFTTEIANAGTEPLVVDRWASAMIPLPSIAGTLLSWRGVHAAEMAECREPMPENQWARETRRSLPGHGGPPGLYVLADGASLDSGMVLALQIAWSGDTRLAVERTDEGVWVASAEARLQPGELILAPTARHIAPSVFLALSEGGANGAMAQQHAAVRARLNWPGGTMRPRPVHLNTWEAMYFDHDEARIGELAEAAAALGVERFVLDDGWFLGRRDDRRALGDWIPDPSIYPRGLGPLARKVQDLGMQFGLWVEPEMVSPDSELYRKHPEWALALQSRPPLTGRHQLVLDMRQAAVRDYLFAALDRLLRDAPIDYLKWDHNRDLAPPGGAAQVKGTYELLCRLRSAHPSVEIESCAGGGGRIDAGIAAYTHRFWTSDNLDAVSRVAIQRGFAAFMPPELMGAHVGASPAHATGRSQSLAFRSAVACMGHFGLELDPTRLSETERHEIADWIAFYKRWRGLIHCGELRLGEDQDGLQWQAHGDGRQWLLFVIRTQPAAQRRPTPLRLPFAAAGDWHVTLLKLAGANRWLGSRPWKLDQAEAFSGSWLARSGLPMLPLAGEAVAIFHLRPAAS